MSVPEESIEPTEAVSPSLMALRRDFSRSSGWPYAINPIKMDIMVKVNLCITTICHP